MSTVPAVERPSTDEYFWATYLLFFPTALVGMLLSGPMVYSVLREYRKLIKSRLDKVVLILLIISFVFSTSTCVRYVVILFYASNWMNQFEAAISICSLVWFLGSNVLLALTRYFIVKERPPPSTRKFVALVLLIESAFSCVLIWVFSTAVCALAKKIRLTNATNFQTSQNRTNPDPYPQFMKQRIAFYIICALTAVPGLVAIITIYSSTYNILSRRLQATMSAPLENHVRLLLQKRVLKTTIAMSSGTVICYSPMALAIIVFGVILKTPLPDWGRAIVTAFALFDTIVTPCLLLYLMPKIRHAVAARWWCYSRLKAGSFTFDSEDYEEEESYSL